MRYEDVPRGKSRGTKKLATGRFNTRYELEAFVWRMYKTTDMNTAQIARAAQVSESLANLILNNAGRYVRMK